MKLKIIDVKTGKYPDLESLIEETWVENLSYCDIEGFAINEDGNLILLDECGDWAYCPADRFVATFE